MNLHTSGHTLSEYGIMSLFASRDIKVKQADSEFLKTLVIQLNSRKFTFKHLGQKINICMYLTEVSIYLLIKRLIPITF